MNQTIIPVKKVAGEIELPGDKSISHRALMVSAIAEGNSVLENVSRSEDVTKTVECLQELGVKISRDGQRITVTGKGLHGLRSPKSKLDVGNSGTTIRLLSGILAGQKFETVITGDQSIRRRPMLRIAEPLRKMGAHVEVVKEQYAPLTIKGGSLKAIDYEMPIASAQVKSCLLFAGLYAQGKTTIYEKAITRDHTELMLVKFGAAFFKENLKASVVGPAKMSGQNLYVPGDLSSAAFFIAACILIPDSSLLLKNVGINPTRRALITVLAELGVDVQLINIRPVDNELMADLYVRNSAITPGIFEGRLIPQIIDEIPILAVLATQADGQTIIRNAEELHHKESDRIRSIVFNLKRMGADVVEKPDGLVINGPVKLKGANVESFGDHRIAMAFSVAALIADSESHILDFECVATSYPEFFQTLDAICER